MEVHVFLKIQRAIVDVAKKHGEDMLVIKAAIEANQKQKKRVIEKIISKMMEYLEKL